MLNKQLGRYERLFRLDTRIVNMVFSYTITVIYFLHAIRYLFIIL